MRRSIIPHYLGNTKVQIVNRKVFENFNRCFDSQAWLAACTEQPNDSFREFAVGKLYSDPDDEYLRQWLLANGAEESDEVVFLAICW